MGKKRSKSMTSDSLPDSSLSKASNGVDQIHTGFPIVGIGASAGGLAAFEAFFSGMPTDTDPGMAFVLVQHLAPDHKSMLTDLIRRYTRMQVFEVEDGMAVQPNCTYIIPPNRDMAFFNGMLQLMEPSAPRGQRLPIDFFFRSLAQDQHERAIGIILSGTGSDGTLGVRAIKGEGGMVMVQNPASTEYDSMPRNAIATGSVDYELPPAEMPAQLIAYVNHAIGKPPKSVEAPSAKPENALNKIFLLLRTQTNHDFSQYKMSTIHRRIERRMAVQQVETIEKYVKYLQQTPPEVESLFRDLLIGVTSFFRDPEAFKALEEQVIPKIVAEKPAGAAIRVWSAGCSTGEEAYSIAILFAERQEVLKQNCKVQVFATDIDAQAIAAARAGIYPASIVEDISPERLKRFFHPEPGGVAYRISKGIRDMLVFSEQDVIKDPPFSKLDLISCRNLLIYMGGDLQKRLIPLFHYALNPGAFLFLGSSETIGDCNDLFETLDRKWKLFRGKAGIHFPQRAILGGLPTREAINESFSPDLKKTTVPGKPPLKEITEQALLERVVQVGVLVNGQGDILYLHGRSGLYLEPTPGVTGTNNILKMAREGLRRDLAIALHKAVGSQEIVRCPGLRIKTNGNNIGVDLTVCPITASPISMPENKMYLVTLEKVQSCDQEQAEKVALHIVRTTDASEDEAHNRIMALKQELRAKEEYLHTAVEEMETNNEELKSSNEEMQSINEELQSTNEELETSKEELQSVNEELATVNVELQTKVAELSQANNDMNNLLAGTGIATVFVDHGLKILRFTPSATRIINLILSDVGRPVGHVVTKLVGYDRMVEDIESVLNSLIPKELEVQTQAGAWFIMRIQPYRTLDNVIEGVVLTFMDITKTKTLEEELRLNQESIRNALQAAAIAIFTQNKELRYTWIQNPGHLFSDEKILGKTDADLLPERDAAKLTAIKRQVLESGQGTRIEIRAGMDDKPRFLSLTLEPLRDPGGDITGIVGASWDITEHRVQGQSDAKGEGALSKKDGGD